MTKAVLFDLDGTLLDRHSSLILYVHQQIDRCSPVLGNVPPLDYLNKVIELDAHGHQTKDIVFQEVEKYFGLPDQSWQALLDDFFQHFPDICVPFPHMHQTLQVLQQSGYSLGLITNGSNASQNPKINGLGIRYYFGAVLISEAEGVKKPDSEIFDRCLRQLHVTAQDAVFVGDNPEADIHGAQSIGIRAIWMRDSYWPEPSRPDGIICQLSQLPDLLEKMNENNKADFI
ncbi:MAG: HAD family hydrolase [Cyanobacteria bacterium P01_D01_bin.56]